VPLPVVYVALDNTETTMELVLDAETANIKVTKERPNVFLVKMEKYRTKEIPVVSNPII
jgi:hypothetical protein